MINVLAISKTFEKLLFGILVILIVTVVFPFEAEAKTYEIEKIGLSLDIPSTYDVFTRDISNNDPLLKKYGYTKQSLLNQFNNQGIYLDAITSSGNTEIVVSLRDGVFDDFVNIADGELLAVADMLEELYEGNGMPITKYEVYHHPQLTFLKLNYHSSDKSMYGIQYYTVHNGIALNLSLFSYSGKPTSAQSNRIQSVAKSIKIDMPSINTKQRETMEGYQFTDIKTGVTFQVPPNWRKEDLSKERETLDAEFVSTEDSTFAIMYGSTDMWSEVPGLKESGVTRSELDRNFSSTSTKEFAETIGISPTDVKKVTYNGNSYFMVTVTSVQEIYGISVTVTLIQLFHVENGWIYNFQFTGTADSKYFGDYESLVNSVKYPTH